MELLDPSLDEFCSEVQIVPAKRPSDKCPWSNGCEYIARSTSLALHKEILDFTRWILPTRQEDHLRHITIQRFRTALNLLWPDAKLCVHGSSATGLYLPGSDIDLIIMYDKIENTKEANLEALEQFAAHIDALQIVRKTEVINATCPIIKAIEKPFGYHLDISINHPDGILQVHRVRALAKNYPAIIPFVVFIKFFLFQNHLDEPFHGGISSNTALLMAQYILQTVPDEYSLNLGKLVMTFFKVFGTNFNFITTGISTRGDGCLFSRIATDRIDFKKPLNLCIENPQKPGVFVGENAFNIVQFQEVCKYASMDIMRSDDSPSLLLRVIKKPDWIIRRRAELDRQYNALIGEAIESFSLGSSRPKKMYEGPIHKKQNYRPPNDNQHRQKSSSRNEDPMEFRPQSTGGDKKRFRPDQERREFSRDRGHDRDNGKDRFKKNSNFDYRDKRDRPKPFRH